MQLLEAVLKFFELFITKNDKIQHSDTWSTLFQRQESSRVYHVPLHLADSWENWRLHEGSLEITVNRVGPGLALTKTLSQKDENSVNHLAAWSIPYCHYPMDYNYSPWNSPGQNARVGSLSLLQGIFPTQGSNTGLPPCRQICYQLSHKGNLRKLKWIAYPLSRGSS